MHPTISTSLIADVEIHQEIDGDQDEADEQYSNEDDPRISELLQELDQYVLGTPAEARPSDLAPAEVCSLTALVPMIMILAISNTVSSAQSCFRPARTERSPHRF